MRAEAHRKEKRSVEIRTRAPLCNLLTLSGKVVPGICIAQLFNAIHVFVFGELSVVTSRDFLLVA